MARKKGLYAPPEYDLDAELAKLDARRPRTSENKLVFVPSLRFLGRTQDEDNMEDGVSYRRPLEFVEFAFPTGVPDDVYPCCKSPRYGFTCGDRADARYSDLEAMCASADEVFYDEFGFDFDGSPSSTRTAFIDICSKLAPGASILARLAGEDDFAEMTYDYLERQIGISEQFLWSYAFNARGLIFPLLSASKGRERDLRQLARGLAGGRSRLLNSLAQGGEEGMGGLREAVGRPGFLAMLYALRNASQAQRDDVLERMMDPSQHRTLSIEGYLEGGAWIGRGGPLPCPGAADDVAALLACGLLEADADEAVLRITDEGETLMDMLPGECNCPERVFELFDTEWAIPHTAGEVVHEWITAFFEKVARSARLKGLRKAS